jgi:hypothetical protein
MIDQEYVSALVVFDKSSTTNLALLQARVIHLFAYITTNEGKDLVSVTLPGQHMAWSKPYTAQEEFSAIQQALQIIAGKPTIVHQFTPVIVVRFHENRMAYI